MSIGWIIFWAAETLLLGIAVFIHVNEKSTSQDGRMGDEIGVVFFVAIAAAIALIGFVIFAWRHFRFSP